MTFYRPQTRHTENVRTRDDHRAQLAQFLTFASDEKLADTTVDMLAARHPKLPRKELAQALDEANARRAARHA